METRGSIIHGVTPCCILSTAQLLHSKKDTFTKKVFLTLPTTQRILARRERAGKHTQKSPREQMTGAHPREKVRGMGQNPWAKMQGANINWKLIC